MFGRFIWHLVLGIWGWAWPADRRILYNRASADPDGRPWSERKAYVWWDEEQGKWTGHDVPDFIVDRPPSYRPAEDAKGIDTLAGDNPFVLQADGRGWLYAPNGLIDGPLPAHYEPQESVIRNPLYGQQQNPARLAAKGLTAASLAASLLPGRSRVQRTAMALLGTAGALALRFAVFHAGKASVRDPRATFRQQRET